MASIPLSGDTAIAPRLIAGMILAGGRGSRMGGVDKGLQSWQGMPLAMHALRRLRPQVGQVTINANRNLPAYESMGVPVWPDTDPDHPGPLAGFAAGLQRCELPYLLTVPCDSPRFPTDLAARLSSALQAAKADIAMAATRDGDVLRAQPVFCLMKADLLSDLRAFLRSGQRRVGAWTARLHCAEVPFDDFTAFAGANTLDELHRL